MSTYNAELAIGPLNDSVTTVATLGHTGTTTLTAAQYQNRVLLLDDSGLTGNATVVLPTINGFFIVDTTGVTFGGHDVILSMGTAAKTLTIAAAARQLVYSDGIGSLYAAAMT
jgi:hypothetical protein